jgi:hypothetical protein
LLEDPEEPVEYAILQEPGAKLERFPDTIEMAMSRNYYCEKCDSTVSLTVSKATYTNPKVVEIVK